MNWTAEHFENARIVEGERSLHFFVRLMWPVLEPAAKFADGWWPRAWCEHLEAVTDGDITRLIGNCPPGSTKSLLTNVFWPAWVWGPRNRPWMRFLTAAYSQTLTERDNDRMRVLIQSPEYQRRWGRRFKAGDSKINFQNDKTGWKLATSVGGTVTGLRGDVFICFAAEQSVWTEHGSLPIGQMVNDRWQGRVASFNEATGGIEWKPVVGWHRNPGAAIVRLEFASGLVVKCTTDHRLWLGPGKWKAASDIPVGSVARTFDWGEIVCSLAPDAALLDSVNLRSANVVNLGEMGSLEGGGIDRAGNISGDLGVSMVGTTPEIGDMREGAVTSGVIDVLGASTIAEVGQASVISDAVAMSDFLANGARSNERLGNFLVNPEVYCSTVSADIKARVTLPVIRGADEDFLLSQGVVAANDGPCVALDTAVIGDGIVGVSNDGKPALDRLVSITHEGFAPVTYCITVADNHSMLVGQETTFIVAANCDDPNNVNESESKTVRENTNRWLAEVMPTRLNHPERSAIVVIQQRTHQEDATGFLLRKDRGGDKWTYVMVPMSYDPEWTCGETAIGWSDPRTRRGELFWPERFSPSAVEDLKAEMTEYAWAGQMQQNPKPRGGAIIKDEWWKLYGKPDEDPTAARLRFPAFSYVVASLDCALTDKDENDPSALVVLGIWTVPQTGQQAVMVIYCWTGRLQINDLVKEVAKICDKYHIDTLIIENKANGHSVQQEIRRMYQQAEWSVQFFDPTRIGDKVARAHSVTHLFEEGMIWRPNTEWAELLIEECSIFPRGSHDDRVDAIVAGLRHLREHGLLFRRQEARWHEESIAQLARSQIVPRPIYDV
jgi:predicted phage terminase large subunit-like protein